MPAENAFILQEQNILSICAKYPYFIYEVDESYLISKTAKAIYNSIKSLYEQGVVVDARTLYTETTTRTTIEESLINNLYEKIDIRKEDFNPLYNSLKKQWAKVDLQNNLLQNVLGQVSSKEEMDLDSMWEFKSALENRLKEIDDNSKKIEITGYNQNKELVYYNKIKTTGWYYTTSISKQAYEKPLKNLVSGFVWAILLSVILAILIMYKLIQNIIKPIESLNNTVQKFSSDNMTVRTNVVSEDEIGKLGQSFNQMADTIQDYSNSLEKKVEEKTKKIRDKNKTIMESIDYASRIQNSIIPDLSSCLNIGKNDYFAIWQPREKVGGDIFWCKSAGNYSLLAVVDCTGHGVPGAFMSMMLNSILNSVIKDIDPTNPAKILNEVDIQLKENLSNKSKYTEDLSHINDGADMALIVIDKKNKKLIFSGAKLDMYSVKDSNVEKITGARRSIGYSLGQEEFKNKKIDIKSNDKYYFTTDGFLDQNSKDYNYGIGKKGFSKLVNKISEKSMSKQKEIIKKDIKNKISQVEQRDDITVIGLNLDKFSG